ncbi:MAG: cupin domain-containing protein [Actinomycetota bacterium]|nr:cupin domain-containing protein [Actinomycetota bacterium]
MTSAAQRCVLIRDCDVMEPPQGAGYMPAISDQAVGSTGLWFGLVRVATSHRTKAHTHPHETGLYVVKGSFEMYSGSKLEDVFMATERDFILIPRGVPHVAVNRSEKTPIFAVVARSNPAHEEPADLLPELDALVP